MMLAPSAAQVYVSTVLLSELVVRQELSSRLMPSFFAYSSAVRSMSSASGAPEAENWISKPPVPRKVASP